jgi:hypothetical protein
MKSIKLFSLAIMAMFAVTGALAASASAEELPNVLPGGSVNPVTAATSSGEAEFGNGLVKVTATSSTGSQTGNATKLGSFTTTFSGAKDILGRKCTGLGETTEGVIKVTGTFHIRDFKEKGTLLTASIQLLNEVHFSCGTLLERVQGCVAGALTPENVKAAALTLTLAKNGSLNDNLIITVLRENNSGEEACQLLAADGTGAFELSSQKQTVTINGFTQQGLGIEVEVMRL